MKLLKLFALAGVLVFTTTIAEAESFVWAKKFKTQAYSVAVDRYGSVYVVGEFSGTVDFDPGPSVFNLSANGPSNIFVTKFGKAGAFIWARRFGGAQSDDARDVAVTSNGQIYMVADSINALQESDVFISKLDSAGQVAWIKRINYAYLPSVAADPSGNLLITGSFYAETDFDPGPGSFHMTPCCDGSVTFVLKLDSAGNFIWAGAIQGLSQGNRGNAIATDNAGSVYVTGWFKEGDFDLGPGEYFLTAAPCGDCWF